VNSGLVRGIRDRIGSSLFVDRNEQLPELVGIGRLERRKVRSVTGWDFANLTESSDRAADNTARFRVTDGGLNLDETRKEVR
jgi:hypothetical protein